MPRSAQIHHLIAELGRVSSTEIVADTQIGPGGCRVLTAHGEIDQRLETQLSRIVDELTDDNES
ncbi:MAG: FliH/SctL family protein [Pirellulales bacterium]